MNNEYKITANAIRHAEEALNTLKDFTTAQYEAKGNTMIEQVADYIKNILSNANYMCCGCKYYRLALSNMKTYFVFYIYDGSAIGSGYPVLLFFQNGKVEAGCGLSEWMMLTLVEYWDGFKKELDTSIKRTMKDETESINKQLAHISYVNEQLSKWHV